MSHPVPRNDPDNTYPVRKFGTGKPVHFQGKTGIPKHKLTGGLEGSVKRMLDITPNSGIGAKTKALKGKAGELHKRASEGSFARMNKERKAQGFKPKTDRATKGLYDFLDN